MLKLIGDCCHFVFMFVWLLSQDFVMGLSILLRGTIQEKLNWAFNLYDINKDGYITKEVGQPAPEQRKCSSCPMYWNLRVGFLRCCWKVWSLVFDWFVWTCMLSMEFQPMYGKATLLRIWILQYLNPRILWLLVVWGGGLAPPPHLVGVSEAAEMLRLSNPIFVRCTDVSILNSSGFNSLWKMHCRSRICQTVSLSWLYLELGDTFRTPKD